MKTDIDIDIDHYGACRFQWKTDIIEHFVNTLDKRIGVDNIQN
jgi:hypothetical protein